MNTKERLAQSEVKMKELSNRYNQLESEKQELVKEFLRLEGEIRILKELEAEDVTG